MDNLLKQFAQSSQLAGGNAAYIEDLYEQYLVSPDSIDPKWKTYFDGFQGRDAGDVPHSAVIAHIASAARQAANSGTGPSGDERERHVGRLITAYRSRGHLGARLDPLGLTPPVNPPDLGLPFHSLSESDLGSEFSTGGLGGQPRMKL
ncbi:2-oxoglutarate dehydrogenase E1 subunit family protein, partial [Xanthomonas sp. SHU 199]